MQAVSTRVVLKLVWQNSTNTDVPGYHLLLGSQVLFLPSHEVLLFLFSALECILLLSSQGGAKTWEAVSKRRLGTW
jgi:hypothetical protein